MSDNVIVAVWRYRAEVFAEVQQVYGQVAWGAWTRGKGWRADKVERVWAEDLVQ